jgi:hypothetical protein
MIHRCKRHTRFTIVNNILIENERLSLPALGLLVYLLHKPDNWEVYPKHLAANLYKKKNSKAGYRYILELINELEEHGYCKKAKHFDGSVDYYIYDEPNVEILQQAEPNVEILQQAEPNAEILHLPNAEKPHAEIPHDIINTNLKTNTNYISSSTKSNDLDFFEEFWKIYPRKSNRSAAQKKFNRLNPKKQQHIIALTRYFADDMQGKSQEYILMATTYLNQERYLDYEQTQPTSEILQTKEGAEVQDCSSEVLDALSGKVLKLVKMYQALEDEQAKSAFDERGLRSFRLSKNGVSEQLFSVAELEVLKEVGASVKEFSELEWRVGEIRKMLKGYVC